ncbi:MAG: DNA mismatch repair protein MutL, partial [Angelakisella sp.]|nr:DNA mismatch repair protein MutL [Angelakisella sp.]
DKHAAHERILFNRLKQQHQCGAVERQVLLAPQTVMLSHEQYEAALSNPEYFERAGFAVEDFGDRCVRIREVPAVLEDSPVQDLVTELCERLLQGGREENAIFDELYHSVACKAAIKGNIPSSEREQKELLRLLREDPTVRNCPHGRPVAVAITRRELEKMFGRIV